MGGHRGLEEDNPTANGRYAVQISVWPNHFLFSISTGNGLDFEEQLIHAVGKIPALSNRHDLIDIDVNVKWNGEMSV